MPKSLKIRLGDYYRLEKTEETKKPTMWGPGFGFWAEKGYKWENWQILNKVYISIDSIIMLGSLI